MERKETTPVIYNSSGVKILNYEIPGQSLCFPIHWHERLEMALFRVDDPYVKRSIQL